MSHVTQTVIVTKSLSTKVCLLKIIKKNESKSKLKNGKSKSNFSRNSYKYL